MFRADNSFNLLIAKALTPTASAQIKDIGGTGYIADGEILVLDSNDAPMVAGSTDNITDSPYFRIVQGRTVPTTFPALDEPLVMSARINGRNILKVNQKTYSAPQEQIWVVGFNGTSGSIDTTGSNPYILRLNFKFNKYLFAVREDSKPYFYQTDGTYTQANIVKSIAKDMANDKSVQSVLKVEMLVSGTFTASSQNVAVTNGSDIISYAAALATAPVAGDVIRIGGTGNTAPVYVVKSVISSTIYQLTTPYQGASATVLAANTGIMSAMTDWGIKLTGKALQFSVGKFKYNKVRFDLNLTGFGATTLTKTQEALLGNGTYEEIAELEWMAYGFNGAMNRHMFPEVTGRTDAVSGATYDVISIEYESIEDGGKPVSGSKPSRQLLYIAFVVGSAQKAPFISMMNAYLATVPGAFAIV